MLRALRSLVLAALVLAALYPAQGQTTGSIGFKDATSQGVVSYTGTWDAFPGECILATDRRLVTFNTGPNEVPGNSLVYKLSANGTSWPASPTTLYTPSAGITSQGTECATLSDGNVVVSTMDEAASPLGIVYVIKGAVSGTTGGTNNDGITWGSKITAASGNPFGGSGVYTGPSKVLETAPGTWLLPVYGGFSSFTGWGLVQSTDSGATWGATNVIIPGGDGINAWSEVGWIIVPVGYPNAGRIYAAVRRDLPSNAEGYYLTYCNSGDDPTVAGNWTTPSLITLAINSSAGRPTLLFVPKGTNGGLFLLARFNQTPKAGYTISWDVNAAVGNPATATWQPARQFGGVSYNAQFWYGSAGLLSDGTIAGIVSQALNGQSTVASVVSRDFLAVAP